jgi:hypothetical protein
MKKLYFIIGLLSCTVFAQTSMTVRGTSYMYVKNSFVFVKNGIDLQTANNFIYLRNEGQLLQGRVGANANLGLGKLSVFQEGTSGQYAYNYWCAPVGSNTALAGPPVTNIGDFGITMMNRPTTNIASTPAIASLYTDKTGVANPLKISSRYIYTYDPGTAYSEWDYVGGASIIPPGRGFSMKGTSGSDELVFAGETTANKPIPDHDSNPLTTEINTQRYDFRGRANSGDISILVEPGQETLTGNPYPSAIDLKAFLIDPANAACDRKAYFWEHDKTVLSHNLVNYKGGYGVYSPLDNLGNQQGPNVAPYGLMGIYVPATFYAYNGAGTQLGAVGLGSNYERRFCPIGQGFNIKGIASGSVTMKDSYRVYQKEGAVNYSQFERIANSSSEKVVNDTNTAGFLPEIPSVSGFDYTTVSTAEVPQMRFNGMINNQGIRQTALAFIPGATDGYEMGMEAESIDGYSKDYYFAIENKQCLINVIEFDINKKIPLGFKNDDTTNFKLTLNEMINFETPEVYVHDKVNDTYTDLINGVFEVNLPGGVNNTQYEITFTSSTLATNNNTVSNFTVFQNNDKELLNIANPNKIDINNVILYDVVGKVIFDKKETSSKDTYQYSTSTYSDGVYIVKIISKDDKEFSQKVIISNTK